MRKGLFVAGIILLIIGLAAIAYPITVGQTAQIPAAPSQAAPIPPIIGSGSYTVKWSGGTSTTQVTLYQCATSACDGSGPVLATGTGGSGSFTVTLTAGSSYGLYEQGTPISITATLTDMGITPLVLIGLILVVIGAIVLLLSFVTRGRARSARLSADDSVTPPESPASSEETVGGNIQAAAPPPAAPAAGPRPNVQCSHCGAWNEPWITNCRKCQRTLSSTSR